MIELLGPAMVLAYVIAAYGVAYAVVWIIHTSP